MGLIDYTMGTILEKWATETPDHEFLIYPDRNLRFTYAEFNHRVNCVAKGLYNIGVRKGDKVGVWAKNVPDWLTFLFAAAKIGAVQVTVNTNYKLSELEYVMKNADIHTMCLVNGYRDSDYVEIMHTLVPELRKCERGHLRSEKFPELRNVVYIGQEKVRGMYNTAEMIAMGTYIDLIVSVPDIRNIALLYSLTRVHNGYPYLVFPYGLNDAYRLILARIIERVVDKIIDHLKYHGPVGVDEYVAVRFKAYYVSVLFGKLFVSFQYRAYRFGEIKALTLGLSCACAYL